MMDPRAMRYSSYGYPNASWGYSGYNIPYYGYPTTAPVNYSPPASEKPQPGQRNDVNGKTDKNKGLVAAVIILALLLLAVIIALIVVGTLYQQKGQSSVKTTTAAPATTAADSVAPTTIIGFSVKRNDMTYQDSMADPTSPTFAVTCNLFCNMICNEWLENKITTDACKCSQLRPGSVIADIKLTANSSLGTPESILSTLRLAVPYKSEQDPNTDAVDANSIVILTSDDATMQPVTPTTAIIIFTVNRTDMTYDEDMANQTSNIFNITCNLFCEMICVQWLEEHISQDSCKCTALRPGSVIADITLTVNITDTTPEAVLSILKLALPVKSSLDKRTDTVEANDIVLAGTSVSNAPNPSGTKVSAAPTTSKPSPTIFGLNVTRTDLQYVADLADPNSETFSNISFQFCDMIMREWLAGIQPTDTCKCVKFWRGSVICEGHVEVDTNGTSATTLLAQVGVFINMQSSFDSRTPTIQASDIIIVE